ncbi:MAG: formyltetrahydrofolate deformylase [Deltaproteobacteria bacterium]|nr:formyltetrahydrofolate deformylase [Deltaproteobacteria bacterium]
MARPLIQINVVGTDKRGVIARFTGEIFKAGGNIEDLEQHVQDQVFAMTLEVDASDLKVPRAEFDQALRIAAEDLQMELRVYHHDQPRRARVGVLVTREPACLNALLAAQKSGQLNGDIVTVIGTTDALAPLAMDAGLQFHHVETGNQAVNEGKILEILSGANIDLVVLARYMRILSPKFVLRYLSRIINLHPSLLPSFPGASAYRQAHQFGARIVGCTAHYVTTDLDRGPVIAQSAFAVETSGQEKIEDIIRRGQALEGETLLRAVQLHLAGRLRIVRNKVEILSE